MRRAGLRARAEPKIVRGRSETEDKEATKIEAKATAMEEAKDRSS